MANSHHIELNASKDILITKCRFLGHVEESTLNESIQLDLSKRGVTKQAKRMKLPAKMSGLKIACFLIVKQKVRTTSLEP